MRLSGRKAISRDGQEAPRLLPPPALSRALPIPVPTSSCPPQLHWALQGRKAPLTEAGSQDCLIHFFHKGGVRPGPCPSGAPARPHITGGKGHEGHLCRREEWSLTPLHRVS